MRPGAIFLRVLRIFDDNRGMCCAPRSWSLVLLGCLLPLVSHGCSSNTQARALDAAVRGDGPAGSGGSATGGISGTGATAGTSGKGGATGSGDAGSGGRPGNGGSATDGMGIPDALIEPDGPVGAGGNSGGDAITGSGGGATGGAGGSGDSSTQAPQCPATPPGASACAPEGFTCYYDACPAGGRTIANCSQGTWSVTTGACGKVSCAGPYLSTGVCDSGQICTVSITGARSDACIANSCGAGPVTLDCLSYWWISSSCYLTGDVTTGFTVICDSCGTTCE